MCAAVDLKKVANMCVPFHCIPTKYFQNLSLDTSLDYKLDLQKFSSGSPNRNELALMIMPGYGSNNPVSSVPDQTSQSIVHNNYNYNANRYVMSTASVPYPTLPSVPTTFSSSSCHQPISYSSSSCHQPISYTTSSQRPLGYYDNCLPVRQPTACCDKHCPTSRACDARRPPPYCTRRTTAMLGSMEQSFNVNNTNTQTANHGHSLMRSNSISSSMGHMQTMNQPHSAHPASVLPQALSSNLCSASNATNSLGYIRPVNHTQAIGNCHSINHIQPLNHTSHVVNNGQLTQSARHQVTEGGMLPRLRRRSARVNPHLQHPTIIDLTQDSPTVPNHGTVHHLPNLYHLIDSCDMGVGTMTTNVKPTRHQPFATVSELHHAQQAPTTSLYPHPQLAESAGLAGLTLRNTGPTQNPLHIQPAPHNNSSRRVNLLMPALASCVPCGSSGAHTPLVNNVSEHSTVLHNATFLPATNNNMSMFTQSHLSSFTPWCRDNVAQMSIPQNLQQQSTVCAPNDGNVGQSAPVNQLNIPPYNTRKRSRDLSASNVAPVVKKLCVLQSTENIINTNTYSFKPAANPSVPDCADKLTTSLNERSILTSAENFDSFLNLYLFSTNDNATADLGVSQNVDTKRLDADLTSCNSKRLIRDNTSLSRSVQARAS